MSEQDIEFARSAFNNALPEVEYRAGATQAPRPHNGRKAAVMAGTSIAAAAALFAVSSATTSAPAWSATPSSLSSADSAKIDQQCRSASSDIIVVGGSSGQTGSVQGGGGVQVSGGSVGGGGVSGSTVSGTTVTVSSGNVATGAVPSTGPAPSTSTTVQVGGLPLLLIDSRGQSALAVYGDSTHHVICNVDPQTGTTLSPDSGAWSAPVAPALISANAALAMGTVVVGDANGSKGTMQIVGTIDPSVRSMTVEVPNVGTVTATVKDGYYSLFIPNSMIQSTESSWPATITLNDGTVRTEPLNQSVGISGGAINISGSNP